jgi:hypothetical protein
MNTQWAVQQLERLQVPVTTAAVSSPFNELQETAKWWLSQAKKEYYFDKDRKITYQTQTA